MDFSDIVIYFLRGILEILQVKKGKKEPNQRGLIIKLTEFANFFDLCPVNFFKTCIGPMETYYSHCGRYRSTLE